MLLHQLPDVNPLPQPPSLNTPERAMWVVNSIATHNQEIADYRLKAFKYRQMSSSAFAFFRATAHLFYADIAGGTLQVPENWARTPGIICWTQGDAHLQNMGIFHNSQTQIVFDLNDFDESHPAPFYWDLLRFTTSIYLAQNLVNFNMSNNEADELAKGFLRNYHEALKEGQNKPLSKNEVNGIVREKIKAVEHRDQEDMLDKYTVLKNGKRRFDYSNLELEPISTEEVQELIEAWPSYVASVPQVTQEHGPGALTLHQLARRMNSGLGSLGVVKYYALVGQPGTDPDTWEILEIKEQQPAAATHSQALPPRPTSFPNEAARSHAGAQALLLHCPHHVGILQTAVRAYMVSPRSRFKAKFEPEDFEHEGQMKDFLHASAQAFAMAHTRSNPQFGPNALQAIDQWSKAKRTLREVSKAYAHQVARDYLSFLGRH